MTEKRRYRINKLRLREVSLVPEGDNPGAEVLISKARDRADELSKAILKSRYAAVSELANQLMSLAAGEGGEEGVSKAHSILGGMNMDIEELQTRLDEIEGNLETVTKAKDDAEAKVTAHEATIATLTAERDAALSKAKDGGEGDDDEEILKSVPKSIRDRLAKAEKTAEDAVTEISKARDERELEVAISKVKSLGVVEGQSKELGAVLHRISKGKSTPEDAEKVVELITIAKAVGDKGSKLFEAIGKAKGKELSGDEATDGEAKLNEAIEAIQKAKPALTREQAYAEALDANPDLYDVINKRHPDTVDA